MGKPQNEMENQEIDEASGLLAASGKRFLHILDFLMEGVQVFDFNWKYLYVNDALVKYSAYTKKQLLGHTVMELYPGIETTSLFATMKRCMEERVSEREEKEFVFPDGSKSDFEISMEPMPEGLFILSLNRSEQVKTKNRLLKMSHLYAFISQVNQNIVRVKDEVSLFNNACNIAVEYGHFKMAWIGLLDAEGKKIVLEANSGIPDKYLELFTHTAYKDNIIQDYVVSNNTYYTCDDISKTIGLEKWKPFAQEHCINACIVLPIKKGGKTIGTFNLFTEKSDFSESHEIDLLVEVTGDISFALDKFERERQHRQAEEQISLDEKQMEFDRQNLNALINNTHDLMWSLDRDFKLITFNQPFYEIIKQGTGKVIAKGDDVFNAALSPKQVRKFKKWYNIALAGVSFRRTEHISIPEEYWTEISFYPIHNGEEVIGVACHSRNITNIKKAKRQLAKSEAFNRGVLNSLSSHIAVVNSSGLIVAVNEVWRNFAKANGDITLLNTCEGNNYFTVCENAAQAGDETAKLALAGMQDVMSKRCTNFHMEYPCHAPEENRWFEMQVMQFDNDESMIVVVHENITKLKYAMEERDNTLMELEDRVSSRTKELDNKNKNITDSINYAKHIQVGLLSSPSLLTEIFPNSFILSYPRDIVSGDFFWCFQRQERKIIIVADCTGHGVPGALMSIIGNNLLNQIIIDEGHENPSGILGLLDTRLKLALHGNKQEVKDGMDIALCLIDTYHNELHFSGAFRPLFISDESGAIKELLPNRQAIGGAMEEERKEFETTHFSIISGQRIYLSSDGYYSQFGGPLDKKFMKSRFKETLAKIQAFSMPEQKRLLRETLSVWAGDNDQVDDVLVVGIEL